MLARLRPVLAVAVAATACVLALPAVSAQALQARVAVAPAATLTGVDHLVASGPPAPIDLVLTSAHPAALETFLSALSDPSSPEYRHFLTPRQFAQRFGASAAAVAATRRYLRGFGLEVGSLSRGGVVLHARGTTAQLSSALDATVAEVRTPNGLRAVLRTPGTLPADIASHVTAVAGLSSTAGPSPTSAAPSLSPHVTTPSSCPSAGSSGTNGPNELGGYTVSQQAALYGLSSQWAQGHNGSGQTIALYELAPYSAADVSTYFTCYGLAPSISNVSVDGGANTSNSLETTLDIEEAGALAPGSSLEVYVGPNNSVGPLDLFQRIADDDTASVVSTSWGTCELDPTNDPAAEQPIFQQMAAQGQTMVAAAGDNGSSDCYGVSGVASPKSPAVDDPASQPFVTGVGGLSVTSISPLVQSVWADTSAGNLGGSGGGISQIWSRPSWQSAPGLTSAVTMRAVPDLSVMGDPATGFIYYFTGSNSGTCRSGSCANAWGAIGGTSIGSPLVSALFATAAQACSVSRLGFMNPTLYRAAGVGFVDVTQGSNDLFNTGLYSATAGYDEASGLGSPNPATFYSALCPASFDPSTSVLSASPTSARVGTSVIVTLNARDSANAALVNAPVAIQATASSGTVVLDGDSATSSSTGASETLTTSTSGAATFSVTASAPGLVALTATYAGQSLSTTVQFLAASAPSVPGRASVASLTARARGFTLVARAPASTGGSPISAYQYSLNNGTWHRFSATTRTVTVTGLASRRTYHVRVRALNKVGAGAPSAPRAVVTR